MFLLPLPVAPLTSRQILDEFAQRIKSAQTVTVTVVKAFEEFEHPTTTRWWFRKGGYYRSESAIGILICSPTRTWSCKPKLKSYKLYPGVQTDWSLGVETGLGVFGDPKTMPTLGEPVRVKWHGHDTLRVEVDGRKTMTKETKLYFFFDPQTHNQVGVSANLGSITQLVLYDDLKINPKIDDSQFVFVPPKDWKLVKN